MLSYQMFLGHLKLNTELIIFYYSNLVLTHVPISVLPSYPNLKHLTSPITKSYGFCIQTITLIYGLTSNLTATILGQDTIISC